MNNSQITLYNPTDLSVSNKNMDGSEMFDPTTLLLIGTGSSSLFAAFIEYAYERKKRTENEAHA
jgi:hypothetical protein